MPTKMSHHLPHRAFRDLTAYQYQVGEVDSPSGVGSEGGGLEATLPIVGDAELYLAERGVQYLGVGGRSYVPRFPE